MFLQGTIYGICKEKNIKLFGKLILEKPIDIPVSAMLKTGLKNIKCSPPKGSIIKWLFIKGV